MCERLIIIRIWFFYTLTISAILPIPIIHNHIKIILLYTFTYCWDLTISNIFPIISSNIPTKDISVYTFTYWDISIQCL